MTRHQPLRRSCVTTSIGENGYESEIRVGPRSLLDWPKAQLRLLIAGPALLQILVLASGSLGAEFILRTLGARPLSADGRLAFEKVHIVLMIIASLSTFGVGLALALAIRRQLRRVRDAALAAPGILGDVRACAPIPDARAFPPPVALKLVVSHETARESR